MYHQVCFVLFCFVVSLLHFFSLLTLVHKHPKKEDEVVDDDPGIVIDYNDDRQIHQVLQLPSKVGRGKFGRNLAKSDLLYFTGH